MTPDLNNLPKGTTVKYTADGITYEVLNIDSIAIISPDTKKPRLEELRKEANNYIEANNYTESAWHVNSCLCKLLDILIDAEKNKP